MNGIAVSTELIAIMVLAGIVGPLHILTLGLLWKLQSNVGSLERHLNRDIRGMGERLARIEGMLQVRAVPVPSEQALALPRDFEPER